MQKTPNSELIPINVVGSSSFGRYAKISTAKTYNMFESDGWLVNFAGWQRILTLAPAGQGRGIFKSTRGNFMIVVVNAQVIRIDPSLAITPIGALATNAGEVTIDENLNQQICIVDGVNAYIYYWGGPPLLTIQVLGGGLVPNYVTYHNTFFLFGNGAVNTSGAAWYAYIFSTNTTIIQATPGQFALQTKPDYAIAVIRIPSQSANVIVFGTTVCEIFQQVGGTQNYRRINAIGVDYGCLSVTTINASDKYVAWLGVNESDSPVIVVYSNQGFEAISTDGIDYLLGTIKFPKQSTAAFVRIDGHLFYQLTFYNVVDNLTLIFDFDNKKFYNLSDQHLNYHPAQNYAFFNNNIYFVSLNSGGLYQTSTDITVINENLPGAPVDNSQIFEIQRLRITDNVARKNSERFIGNRLVLTIEQGYDPDVTGISLDELIPIISEDSFAPPDYPLITESGIPIESEAAWGGAPDYLIPYQQRVDLQISLDGGNTWSATVTRGLNPIGYRKNIVSWNRLGQTNFLTLKFRFWGTTRFVVNNAELEIRF